MTLLRISSAQRLADTIVERYDLKPPVDIEAVLSKFAAIHDLVRDIPNIDALLLGLDGDLQEVFLNPARLRQRRRFTMAHELGHILIGWHQAHELLCVADGESDDNEEPDLPVRISGFDVTSQEIRAQELEADAFAARALVPRRFVESIADMEVAEMLGSLEDADVSVPAGMRALSDSLAPGYVFALLDDRNAVMKTWHSGGLRTGVPTISGVVRGELIDKKKALRTLTDTGWAYHYGRRIWWGKAEVDLPVLAVGTDWKPVLNQIIHDVSAGDSVMERSLVQTISGICGSLVNDVDDATLERMAGLLVLRLKRRSELDSFVGHPAFSDFVHSRAITLYEALRRRGPRVYSNLR
ncbi:ImmA/IrrE family metallo-endopeptidase [Paenarthrobacter sp. NPDC089714]|uniref:ImmA/IrrE family metallo-endopeptidase n=1 Tax=Paenarthrobacter sp. NPDC089714 TaxID=3364377 RepID=UPI00382EFA66